MLNTDGPAADNNDTTHEESDEQSDDNVEESYPTLGDALAQLGLPEYVGLFESEEMDMETFVSWSTDGDLFLLIRKSDKKKSKLSIFLRWTTSDSLEI